MFVVKQGTIGHQRPQSKRFNAHAHTTFRPCRSVFILHGRCHRSTAALRAHRYVEWYSAVGPGAPLRTRKGSTVMVRALRLIFLGAVWLLRWQPGSTPTAHESGP